MEHGALIGYWPLTGGREGDLFEISGHSQQTVSMDSANTASSALYNTGAYSWVRLPSLWTLALCRKGYLYHPASDSCVKRRPLLAPYFGAVSLAIDGDGAKSDPADAWRISMSLWVYHTVVKTGTLFEVGNVTSLMLSKVTGNPTPSLSAYYGIAGAQVSTAALSSLPSTQQWVHYGLITTTVGTDIRPVFYFKGTAYTGNAQFPAPSSLPASTVFTFGSEVRAYLREVKVWTEAIDVPELLYEQFQY